jgi:hypothetical protein
MTGMCPPNKIIYPIGDKPGHIDKLKEEAAINAA